MTVKHEFVVEATRCPLPENSNACQLPDCFCSSDGKSIPGGLSRVETPQFVVITFDDAVTSRTMNVYQKFFEQKFKNKNGCPIRTTIFVSHEWTNYNDVQQLYEQGNEIASNSITHDNLLDQPIIRWAEEMAGEREILHKFGNVPENSVVGMRAPELAINGDVTFEMMQLNNFHYDNTMSANPGRDGQPFWPQTLDYRISWNCQSAKCPKNSHPGIWEFPINQFYGYGANSQRRAAMLRAVITQNDTTETVLNMLHKNFNRAHNHNKAPVLLTLSIDFLTILKNMSSLSAVDQFIDEVLKMPDVWIASIEQVIQWMRHPVFLQRVGQSSTFQCSNKEFNGSVCPDPNRCNYSTPNMNSQEHSFLTCNQCPAEYPWLNDPTGEKE